MDRIDHAVHRGLTRNARASFRDLGEHVDLIVNGAASETSTIFGAGPRSLNGRVSKRPLVPVLLAFVDIGWRSVDGVQLHADQPRGGFADAGVRPQEFDDPDEVRLILAG